MTEVTEKSASRISEKDDQIQKLTSTLTSTENESRRIKQKAEMLMKKFDETKHENELLVGKVKDLEKHLMRADVATEEKSVEIKQLQVELANSQRKLEDLQQELETKIKRFEEYESECSKEQENMAALESAIEELVSNHDESTAEISRLQEENQNLKKALSAAQSDSKVEVLKLTKEKSVCLKDLQNASEEITKLKQENQTLSGNFEAAMTQSGEEVIKLREEIARLSKDLDTARNTASNETIELQNEIDCLSSTLNEAEEYVKMYMNDMQDAMKLRSQMREIEDLNQELSAKLSGKEAQIEEHKKNEASFSASLESLRLALHEKESELEKLSANKNKISQNEGESDQLRVRELEQKLVNLRTRCAASEEDSSEMKHDLQMKLEAAMKKLKKREEQLESSKAGLANAQSMILKLVKTVEELRKKVKQEKETP
jgi:chromosome segregation ATPase